MRNIKKDVKRGQGQKNREQINNEDNGYDLEEEEKQLLIAIEESKKLA